jgi:hypothetical protein
MKFEHFSLGKIQIDGIEYGYDVVIDGGEIRERKKKHSKKFRDRFGHTPLSLEEKIPWKCCHLVVGTGTGAMPVMDEVRREARRRKVELIIFPTEEAMEHLNQQPEKTNAILHLTCWDPSQRGSIILFPLTEDRICSDKLMRDFVSACRKMSPLVEFTTKARGLKF